MRVPQRLTSYFLLFFFSFLCCSQGNAQCALPRFYDLGFANPSATQTWINCIGDESTPNAFTFSLVSPNTLGGYSINFGDGSPIISGSSLPANTNIDHTYTALGLFTIKITNIIPGCPMTTNTGTFINDRRPKPQIDNSLAPFTEACIPRTLTFIGMNVNSSPSTLYTWTWGDGYNTTTTTLGAVSHIYTIPGFTGCNRSIVLTAKSLCSFAPLNDPLVSATLGTTYSFWSVDQTNISSSKSVMCTGDTIRFTDITARNCASGTRRIRWFSTTPGYSFDRGLKLAFPANRKIDTTFSGPIGTIISVCLTDSNTCGTRTFCTPVQIVAPPVSNFIINTPSICLGDTAFFSNTSSGTPAPTILNLNFGDGTGWKSYPGNINTPIRYAYSVTGMFTVTGVAARTNTKICTDTIRKVIQVNPPPIANFSLSPSTACGTLNVSLVELSTLASSLIWDYGNTTTVTGSPGVSPIVPTYTLPGTYVIKLTAFSNSGCSNSKTLPITLFSNILSTATAAGVCQGQTSNFVDLSNLQYADGTSINFRRWDFGNGVIDASSSQQVFYTYSASGTYLVALTVSSGPCPSTYSFSYVVNPSPKSSFAASSVAGCNPLLTNITNTSTGASSFVWKFGDGTPNLTTASFSPFSHTYSNYSSTTVGFSTQLQSVSPFGCKDSVSTVFQVFPGPIAAFNFTPTQAQCSPAQLTISNLSIGANTFVWNMGDGNTVTTTSLANFTYSISNSTGVLVYDTIRVKAYSNTGCIGETYKVVPIFPDAALGIGAIPSSGCSPLNVQFFSTATAVNLKWSFGDGTQSSFGSPSKIYSNTSSVPSTFIVTMEGKSVYGCSQTVTSSIAVYPKPTASFSMPSGLTGCSPLTATFSNNSFGASTSNWNFGDGTTSTLVGSGLFGYDFVNGNVFSNTFQIKLKVDNTFGCSDSTTKNLTVYPKVTAAFAPSIQSGCSPLSVNLINVSTNAGSYIWDFGDGTTTSGQNFNKIYANTTTGALVYTIKLTAYSSNCQDMSLQTVTVYPKPTANFTVPTGMAGCSPMLATFSNNSLGTLTSNWNFGDGSATTVTGANLISYTFQSNGLFNTIYPVKLRVDNAFGCSDSTNKNLTVYPKVTAAFAPSIQSGCSPLSVNLINVSTNAGSYIWDFGDGTTTSGQNFNKIYANTTTGALVYTIKLTAYSSNCQDMSLQTVTVYPKPTANFTVPTGMASCSPMLATFSNNSLGTLTSNWNFGDGSATTVTGANLISYTFQSNGLFNTIYPVKLRVDNAFGCSDSTNKNLTVYPNVVSAFAPSIQSGCSPLSVNLINVSTNAGSYIWDFGDGTTTSGQNFNKIYANTTTGALVYTIKLTAYSSNCQDMSLQTVTVYPKPTANFTVPTGMAGCSPMLATFSNNSLGTLTSNWNFGDGSATTVTGANLISYTFQSNGLFNTFYPVKLRVDNAFGCSDSITHNLTVYPKVASAFFPSATEGCSPLSVNLINASTNAGTYTWEFGDGTTSSGQNFNKIYANTTTGALVYTIKLTAYSSSCQDMSLQTVTVYPKPTANFTVPSGMASCSPMLATFSNNSLGTLTSNWNFGDGSTTSVVGSNLFDYTYINLGIFNISFAVKLKVDNIYGCSDSTMRNLTVYPKVTSAFVASVTSGCSPLSSSLINTSSNAGAYVWDFVDGTSSSGLNFNKLYANTTTGAVTYDIRLLASSATCSDISLQTVTVYPKPLASFSVVGPVKGCAPYTAQFQNTTLGTVNSLWDFGDGGVPLNSSASVIGHSYTVGGTSFTPKLVVENQFLCKDSATSLVSSFPLVKANFNMTDSANCTPLTVGFNDFSLGAASYSWDFGSFGSSTLAFPVKTFTTTLPTETLPVKLVISSAFGCKDSLSKSVLVRQAPTASLVSTNNFECAPFTASFQNNSSNASNSFWDFGDNSTLFPSNASGVSHQYVNATGSAKVFAVKLITSNGSNCKDSATTTITIYPTLEASFIANKVNGCSPLLVNFTNQSVGASMFQWDFKDNVPVASPSPIHMFVNNTLVSRTDTVRFAAISSFSCKDTVYEPITIYPKPDAQFAVTNTMGCTPLQVQFSNNSTGNAINTWDLGNGIPIRKDSVIFSRNYENATNSSLGFNLKLMVENAFSCKDTSASSVTVYPKPTAAFTSSVSSGCTPLMVNFTNSSSQYSTNKWLYGDGLQDVSVNGVHVYANTGTTDSVFTASLIVYSSQSCADTATTQLSVWARPVAQMDISPNPALQGDSVSTRNYTRGNWQNYAWDFKDGNTSDLKDPLPHVYATDGNYLPSLIVTSNNGCADTTFKNIQIITIPPIAKISGSGLGCGSVTVSFVNNSLYANSFVWDFGDGSPQFSTGSSTGVSHTFTNSLLLPKTYSVTLKALGVGGSSFAVLKDSVQVNPLPVVDFMIQPNDTVYLPNGTISFSNLTNQIDGMIWKWNFGDSTVSLESNPSHTYLAEGIYPVTLIASTQEGCVSESIVSKAVFVIGNVLQMPNAFTPNISGSGGNTVGLGINDVFGPGFITEVTDYSLTIFNKWGMILYESKRPDQGWDGYYNGQLCQEDLYVYKVRARLSSGQTKEQTGEITLLHK